MGNSESASNASLPEVVRRLQRRLGSIPLAGRLHCLPDKIDDKYTVRSTSLGTGGTCNVRLASARNGAGGQYFAVKTMRLTDVQHVQARCVEQEIEVFLSIDHPHIVRLVDVYKARSHLSFVMERLEGGELFHRWVSSGFSEQEAVAAMRQILLAVNYLHSAGIVHRDLKLENFMYESTDSPHLKLIDFGFSKFWNPNVNMSMGCGTLGYIAPEVLQESYTSQCDLWSLGIIAFALLSGYMPFNGTDDEQFNAINAGRYSWKEDRWQHISEAGKRFMCDLLVVDSQKRLTALQALNHPWLEYWSQGVPSTRTEVDKGIVNCLMDFGKAPKFRRACMSMMAWSLSAEDRAKVRDYFLEIDKSKDGMITVDELTEALRSQLVVQDAEVAHIFKALDTNQAGGIKYSDFLAAMVSTRISLHDDLKREAFDRFDADHTGFITPRNMRDMLGESFQGASSEKLLKKVACEESGRVTFHEFSQYLAGCTETRSGRYSAVSLPQQPQDPQRLPERDPISTCFSFLTHLKWCRS